MLKRFDDPKIAAGIVITLLLICVLMLPINQTIGDVGYAYGESGNQQESPLHLIWDWITADSISFFTALLAVSTIALWRVTSLSAQVAKISADVAEKTLSDLETPFVYLIDISRIDQCFKYFELYPHPTSPTNPVRPEVRFKLKNYGRTPAIMQGVAATLIHLSHEPTDALDDLLQSLAVDLVLGPHEQGEREYKTIIAAPFDKTAYQSVKNGDSRIWLHGTIYFSDYTGSRWEQPFLMIWNPSNKRFIPWGHRRRRKK